MVSVIDPPSEYGAPTTAVAGVLSEVSMQSAMETIVLDVAVENSRPLQLVQKRHGPSNGSVVAGSGANGLGLFFDSESQAIADESKEKDARTLIAQVRELNRIQTTASDPIKVGSVMKEVDPPRIFQLHPDLETATHATASSAPALHDIATMRQAIFESVSLAVGAPSGLIRGTIAQSTGNLQQRLFEHRCGALRGEVECVLTAVYHTLFSGVDDDVVVFEKENEPCKDAELVSRLFQAGVLEEGTAKDLVANVLQVKRCGVQSSSSHMDAGPMEAHLALRSPHGSTAPSEAGA